jgi:hypothetical protein
MTSIFLFFLCLGKRICLGVFDAAPSQIKDIPRFPLFDLIPERPFAIRSGSNKNREWRLILIESDQGRK